MKENYGPIRPEDYLEPCCPLRAGLSRETQSIPQRRILEKLDDYMQRRDFSGAERHLLYCRKRQRQETTCKGSFLSAMR